jgi:hypothetical protein
MKYFSFITAHSGLKLALGFQHAYAMHTALGSRIRDRVQCACVAVVSLWMRRRVLLA